MSAAILEIEALEAAYGPSQALFGVDLVVREGEMVALMGRNGMGKTTTIRVACGLMRARAGRVAFAAQDIAGLAPHRIAQLGVGLVPEGRRCFPNLTVHENLIAAARPGAWTLARVTTLFPRLDERHAQFANTLSGGEQQMLAIGRALMTNPRLLILDEATEGLAPTVRAEIWSAIRSLKGEGLSILAVDKSLRDLTAVADHCTILERGRTVWDGPPTALGPDQTARWLGV